MLMVEPTELGQPYGVTASGGRLFGRRYLVLAGVLVQSIKRPLVEVWPGVPLKASGVPKVMREHWPTTVAAWTE